MNVFTTKNAIEWLSKKYSRVDENKSRKKSDSFSIGDDRQTAIAERKGVVAAYVNRRSIKGELYPEQELKLMGVLKEREYLKGHKGEKGNPGISGSVARNNPSLDPANNDVLLVHLDNESSLEHLMEWYESRGAISVNPEGGSAVDAPSLDVPLVESQENADSSDSSPSDTESAGEKGQGIEQDLAFRKASYQSELDEVASQINREYANKPGADVDAIAKRRVGQGPFRNLLEAIFGSVCCVSGLRNRRLLIASHIMRWSKASPVEKTDHNNGLLLSVSWDAVFDKGFVSFDDNGTLMCSEMLDAESAGLLGISTEAKLPPEMLTEGRKKYLSWHREHVFENWKKSPGL